MTAILVPQGRQYYVDNNGNPLVGGKLFTYDTGTNNPRATWADAAQTTPNTNPIILDGRGEATVFWSGVYKAVLKDSLDNTIWTVDNISADSLSSVNQSVIPAVDNLYDLGSPTRRWRNIYGNLYIAKTAAEITAGVDPGDFYKYEGDSRRYATFGDFLKVVSQGVQGLLYSDYTLNAPVATSGTASMTIVVMGNRVITCGAAMNYMIELTGPMTLTGGTLTLDGANLCFGVLYSQIYLPKIDRVDPKRTNGISCLYGRTFLGGTPANVTGANGVGHGYMRECRGQAVGAFAWPTGSGPASDTSFYLDRCETDAASGGATNIFGLSSLGFGSVISGWYRGAATSAPNMVGTGRCEYLGGKYEGLLRGPTTGEGSDNITISGGESIDCVFSGVSVDARITGSNVVPNVIGRVDWTVKGASQHGVFVQASNLDISSITFIGTGVANVTDEIVRLTDSLNCKIGRVVGVNVGQRMEVQLGSGTAPSPGSSAYKTGEWRSDSTSSLPVSVVTGSTLYMKNARTITASIDLQFNEELVYVDPTAGLVDLDVPNNTTVGANVIGHSWEVVILNGANIITVTRDGGGATAINGGPSFIVPAGSGLTRIRIESIGGGNYLVTIPSHFVDRNGTPVGAVTPTFVGQLCRDTSATPDDFFIAVGLTSADWEKLTP